MFKILSQFIFQSVKFSKNNFIVVKKKMSLNNGNSMHKSEILSKKLDDLFKRSNLASKSEPSPGSNQSGYKGMIKKCEEAAKKYIDLPWNSMDSPTSSEEMLKIPDDVPAPCEQLLEKWERLSDSGSADDKSQHRSSEAPCVPPPPSPPSPYPKNFEVPPTPNHSLASRDEHFPWHIKELTEKLTTFTNSRNSENVPKKVEDCAKAPEKSHYSTYFDGYGVNNCEDPCNSRNSPRRTPEYPRSPKLPRSPEICGSPGNFPLQNENICGPTGLDSGPYQNFTLPYQFPHVMYAPNYGPPWPGYQNCQRPCGNFQRMPGSCYGPNVQAVCGTMPQTCDGNTYTPPSPCPEINNTEEAVINKAKEAVIKKAKEAEIKKAKEAEIKKAKEAEINKAKEAEINKAKEAEINKAKEAEINKAKDAAMQPSKQDDKLASDLKITVSPPSFANFAVKDEEEEKVSPENNLFLTPKISETQQTATSSTSDISNGDPVDLQIIPASSRFSDYRTMSEIPQMVRVTNAIKSGNNVEFYVETLRLKDEVPHIAIRIHENFLWLQHNLQCQNNIPGVILPPMPNPPALGLLTIDIPTQIDVAQKTGIFLCDYQENCVGYEHFLNVCLAHPRLGNLRLFEKFLFNKEIPITMKQKKSIFSGLVKIVDDLRMSSFQEPDEDFENFAMHGADCLKRAKDAVLKFDNLVDKEYKLAKSYDVINYYVKSLKKVENTPENMKKWFEVLTETLAYSSNLRIMLIKNRQRTIGSALNFNSGFLESLQGALHTRTLKALDLINAQTAFERASPSKQEKKLDSLRLKRKEFLQMNQMTKPEVARFHRQRRSTIKEAMVELAKSEIKILKTGINMLKKIYDEATQIPVQ